MLLIASPLRLMTDEDIKANKLTFCLFWTRKSSPNAMWKWFLNTWNPLSADNCDQWHVTESISNYHPVFLETRLTSKRYKRVHTAPIPGGEPVFGARFPPSKHQISFTNRGRLCESRKWKMSHFKKKGNESKIFSLWSKTHGATCFLHTEE